LKCHKKEGGLADAFDKKNRPSAVSTPLRGVRGGGKEGRRKTSSPTKGERDEDRQSKEFKDDSVEILLGGKKCTMGGWGGGGGGGSYVTPDRPGQGKGKRVSHSILSQQERGPVVQ